MNPASVYAIILDADSCDSIELLRRSIEIVQTAFLCAVTNMVASSDSSRLVPPTVTLWTLFHGHPQCHVTWTGGVSVEKSWEYFEVSIRSMSSTAEVGATSVSRCSAVFALLGRVLCWYIRRCFGGCNDTMFIYWVTPEGNADQGTRTDADPELQRRWSYLYASLGKLGVTMGLVNKYPRCPVLQAGIDSTRGDTTNGGTFLMCPSCYFAVATSRAEDSLPLSVVESRQCPRCSSAGF